MNRDFKKSHNKVLQYVPFSLFPHNPPTSEFPRNRQYLAFSLMTSAVWTYRIDQQRKVQTFLNLNSGKVEKEMRKSINSLVTEPLCPFCVR